MIEIAAVVSMLLYGPMTFHLTEEPLVLSESYCAKDGQPVDCAEAYAYRADHEIPSAITVPVDQVWSY